MEYYVITLDLFKIIVSLDIFVIKTCLNLFNMNSTLVIGNNTPKKNFFKQSENFKFIVS